MVAAGTMDDFVFGTDVGDLPELEAALLLHGEQMRSLQALNPGDPEIVQALLSYDARKSALGL